MRNIFLTISTIILVFISCKKDEEIVFNGECYPQNLREGVIASYSFSNGSLENGTSFKADLMANDGPIPAADRFGNPNCAYAFDYNPSFQSLSTSNSSFLNGLHQFSISVWYQPQDSSVNGGDLETLVSRNKSQTHCPDRNGEWSVGLKDCRRVLFAHNNSVWENAPLPPPPASCQQILYSLTGSWHHAVAVYNNDHYKIYKDGVLQDSISGKASCTDLHLAEDVGDLYIGYRFTGKIDDILIYNREITSEEVTELYNLDPCCKP